MFVYKTIFVISFDYFSIQANREVFGLHKANSRCWCLREYSAEIERFMQSVEEDTG